MKALPTKPRKAGTYPEPSQEMKRLRPGRDRTQTGAEPSVEGRKVVSAPGSRRPPALGRIAVVMDQGSGFVKTDFAGEEQPRLVLKSSSLVPSWDRPVLPGAPSCELAVGVTRVHPIKHGVGVDWEALEGLWERLLVGAYGCAKSSGRYW